MALRQELVDKVQIGCAQLHERKLQQHGHDQEEPEVVSRPLSRGNASFPRPEQPECEAFQACRLETTDIQAVSFSGAAA